MNFFPNVLCNDFLLCFAYLFQLVHPYILYIPFNNVLILAGEKLTDLEVDDILKHIDLTEDLEGNVKYEGKSDILFLVSFYKNRTNYAINEVKAKRPYFHVF